FLQPKYGVAEKRLASKVLAQEAGDKGDLWILVSCLNDDIDEVCGLACAGLERITGVVNRTPNRAVSTEDDAPLWRQWCKRQQHEFVPVVHWDGTGLRHANIPQKQRLSAMQLRSLWDDLASSESAKAYRAMEALVAAPEQAVTL